MEEKALDALPILTLRNPLSSVSPSWLRLQHSTPASPRCPRRVHEHLSRHVRRRSAWRHSGREGRGGQRADQREGARAGPCGLVRQLTIARVQVVTSAGEEVFFKIKRNTKLSKLQGAYANKVGKDVNSIR